MRAIIWILGWLFLAAYVESMGGKLFQAETWKPIFVGGLIWAVLFDVSRKN